MYVGEKGLAFLISHLTRQRHFSGPLFIVRGHAMTCHVHLAEHSTRSVVLLNVSLHPSSETQGQSVGGGRNFAEKFSRTGEEAPGYQVLPDHFQTASRLPAPDWAHKILCIIVPNRRTATLESLSCVLTRRLLSRLTCPARSPRLCLRVKLSF